MESGNKVALIMQEEAPVAPAAEDPQAASDQEKEEEEEAADGGSEDGDGAFESMEGPLFQRALHWRVDPDAGPGAKPRVEEETLDPATAARLSKRWFLFNDAAVTPASVHDLEPLFHGKRVRGGHLAPPLA